MNQPPRNKSQSFARNLLTAALIALIVWAVIPGLGPDIFHIEARTGLKIPVGRPTPNHSQAQTVLDSLTVRPGPTESNRPYTRDQFGQPWFDADANGCDTRNDILRRDLENPAVTGGPHGCKVTSGTLRGPYSGKTIHFQRGPQTSPLVQIDHVVALGDAWRSGAHTWTTLRRLKFANDPLNLLATDGQTNQDKASAAADTWLPPNRSYRCQYAARQIAVKQKWGLSVTATEKHSLQTVIRGCGDLTLPPDEGGITP